MKDTVTYPLSAIMGDEEESRIDQLERELAAAIASFSEERERAQREGARVIKLQGELVEARAELVETKKELNDKSKFCYAVEQALDGLKGDYVEIILALRKDADRYLYVRSFLGLPDEKVNAAIDAAIKEGGK